MVVLRTAFYSGIVSNNHALLSVDTPNTSDDACSRNVLPIVHIVPGKLPKLQKRRAVVRDSYTGGWLHGFGKWILMIGFVGWWGCIVFIRAGQRGRGWQVETPRGESAPGSEREKRGNVSTT